MTLIVNKPPDELVWPEDLIGRVVCGDALTVLKTMPDAVIQACITSPPYWGLRDYGTASWKGGDSKCDHQPPDEAGQTNKPTSGQRQHAGRFTGPNCYKCGAVRIDQQIGLESTPEEYTAKMVKVFREVRRVLKDDGTLWLNLGDSYCGSWGNYGGQNRGQGTQREIVKGSSAPSAQGDYLPPTARAPGLKPKDLVGIPWMVAFALRADGWYLRSDIIWSKPNPMPESVTDRPTRAHEYLFLMSKSGRYFYDAAAIKEPAKYIDTGNGTTIYKDARSYGGKHSDKQRGHGRRHAGFNDRWDKITKEEQRACGANKRSVWEIATRPFPEAHFATFPEKLIEPCILAGSPKGGIVLDPFFGSGTVGKRAKELSRKWCGIELNPAYVKIAEDRLRQEELF